MSDLKVKPIAADGIPRALEKAERYRLLGEPAQADSIYRDVLGVDPRNQAALRGLVLALTDQLDRDRGAGCAREARELVRRLADDFDRIYLDGIVHEREARAHLRKGGVVRSRAYHGFRKAMECYERAQALPPHAHVDAVLRWNSCVREIERERLVPDESHHELPLE